MTLKRLVRTALRSVTLLIFLVLLPKNISAQPVWLGGTPIITATPVGFDFTIEVDQPGTIYIAVYTGNVYTTGRQSLQIKAAALAGPSGILVATAVLPYTGGSFIHRIMSLNPNTNYTVFVAFENGSSQFVNLNAVRSNQTTPSCPSIFVVTGLNNTDRCVNGDGATKIYNFITGDGVNGAASGILQGATWTIDWGDGTGTSTFHTSAYDNDGPGNLVPGFGEFGNIQYTYNTHEDCFYVAIMNITNPGACASVGAQAETRIPILHGRDLDADGNGDFVVDEVGTGIIDTIRVCEGTEYTTSIEDISTWDCQPDIYYPGDPPGSPSGETNEEPRYLQWVYGGASPDASTEANANTITGNVVIGGLGTVTGPGPGVIGDTVRADAPTLNISAPITIPATAQEGEMFKIYYKNWNKCNPFAGSEYDNSNYIETEIVILIIHAPDPPASSDEEYCEDAIGTLTATPSEGGVLTWYSDPGLTTVVNTGASLSHSHTSSGSYTYYVTETVPPCEGPPTTVTLTINPQITNNTIADNNEAFCNSGDPSIINGAAAGGGDGDPSDDYQWQRSTGGPWSNITGASGEDYDPPTITTTTSYHQSISYYDESS